MAFAWRYCVSPFNRSPFVTSSFNRSAHSSRRHAATPPRRAGLTMRMRLARLERTRKELKRWKYPLEFPDVPTFYPYRRVHEFFRRAKATDEYRQNEDFKKSNDHNTTNFNRNVLIVHSTRAHRRKSASSKAETKTSSPKSINPSADTVKSFRRCSPTISRGRNSLNNFNTRERQTQLQFRLALSFQ